LVRINKHHAEEMHGITIPQDMEALTWLIKYVGAIVTRCKKREDEFTSYERLKSKPYRRELLLWGEKVMYLPAGNGKSRGEDRFKPGIFLCIEDGSDELDIGTLDGVVKLRSIKRLLQKNAETQFSSKPSEQLHGDQSHHCLGSKMYPRIPT